MVNVKKYLSLSQASLLGLLLVCCLIRPSVVIENGGVSNFGNHAATIVPYILSFALAILFLCLAANALVRANRKFSPYARLFMALSLLYLLVLLSTFPRHLSHIYTDIHDDLGIALYAYQFVISAWLVAKARSRKTISLLLLQVLGSLIGLLSILKIIHFLFIGQFLGAFAFALLLVTTFPEVISKKD